MSGEDKKAIEELEKGNRSLMESRIKWKNRYYKEKAKNKDYISKDKIREILKKYKRTNVNDYSAIINFYREIEELLEEN